MSQDLVRHTVTGGEPSRVDTAGLCLLSLDGGGVRGLSTLYILKSIMTRLNFERQKADPPKPPVKPCDVFDLIGGTSTGGYVEAKSRWPGRLVRLMQDRIIAIMLGRLEMGIDECISAYIQLMGTVFEKKSRSMPLSFSGNVQARFDSKKLRNAIETVIKGTGHSPDEPFNKGEHSGCRVYRTPHTSCIYLSS